MNKRAFISYSMNDSEMYIISSVSKYLRNSGFYIYSGSEILPGERWAETIRYEIENCNLFIGVASKNGLNSEWMLKEWEVAQISNRTSIFLIESGSNLNPEFLLNNQVILFDRNNPNNSLLQLEQLVNQAKKMQQKNAQNLIVGGLIGMAIVKLLNSD